MTADLETLVVAAYYFASLLPVPRAGRPPKVSDAGRATQSKSEPSSLLFRLPGRVARWRTTR